MYTEIPYCTIADNETWHDQKNFHIIYKTALLSHKYANLEMDLVCMYVHVYIVVRQSLCLYVGKMAQWLTISNEMTINVTRMRASSLP